MHYIPGSWRHCPVCGEYSYAQGHGLVCRNHPKDGVIASAITQRQSMRLVATLYDESLIHHLSNENKRHTFGAFFLKLEEVTGKIWMPETAYAAYFSLESTEHMQQIQAIADFIADLEEQTNRLWDSEDVITASLTLHSSEEIADFADFVQNLEEHTDVTCRNRAALSLYIAREKRTHAQ